MTYDLADIARKLRMNHETIAHGTLAMAFLQAVEERDTLRMRLADAEERLRGFAGVNT